MKYKSAGLGILKKLFATQSPEVREAFAAALTPEERQLTEAVIATQWVPIALAAGVFEKAAARLFPGDARGVEEIGRLMARDQLSGIYRPVLRVLSVGFAIQQTAKLWRSYFDDGEASARQEAGSTRGTIAAEKCPDMPEANRRIITGYVQGLLELCGAREIQVTHDGSRSERWVWNVTWA